MYSAKINSPITILSANIGENNTEIMVEDIDVFPDAPNLATIFNDDDAETILYTEVTKNSLKGCTRGFQSVEKSWQKNTQIGRMFTAYDHDSFKNNIEEVNTTTQNHIDGTQHAKVARFIIGTSTAGWTAKDCNYLCDGTDDQEEIIQALTALPATGGEVVILDGTYDITASINIPKDNVSIKGNGNATILKREWNGSSQEGVITLTSVEGCKVENLQIDGNKATYASSNNNGIYLNSSSDNTITGNTCNNNHSGIRLYLSNNNKVTGNTCNNNSHGIYLYSSNNTVTGNTCIRGTGQTSDYASDQHTIYLSGIGNDYNLIFSNNCMGKAVVISGGTGNTVFNNKWDESSDFEDLKAEVIVHKADYLPHNSELNQYLSDLDDKGIYKVITFKKPDNTLYMQSILSNLDSKGNYKTCTWKFYNNEEEVILIKVWTFVYDDDGNIIQKEVL